MAVLNSSGLKLILRAIVYLFLYSILSYIVQKPAFPPIHLFFDFDFIAYFNDIWVHFSATLSRLFYVLIITIPLSVGFGIIIGSFKKLNKNLSKDIDFFRSIPATTFTFFIFSLFGDSEFSRNLPVMYVTFFSILFYTYKSISQLDDTKINYLKDMGADYFFIFRNFIVYEYLSAILIAVRQTISLSFLVLISMELIIGSYNSLGIGVKLYDYKDFLMYKEILISIFLIGITGYFLNVAFEQVKNTFITWK